MTWIKTAARTVYPVADVKANAAAVSLVQAKVNILECLIQYLGKLLTLRTRPWCRAYLAHVRSWILSPTLGRNVIACGCADSNVSLYLPANTCFEDIKLT